MKLIEVTDSTYIDYGQEVNCKVPKFEVCGHITISKSKNIFAEGYTRDWSEKYFYLRS